MSIGNHNPFDESESLAISTVTGLTAMEDNGFNCDETEKVGLAIKDQLNGISFAEAKINKKNQIKTLEVLKTGVKIDQKKVHVDPLLLMFSK